MPFAFEVIGKRGIACQPLARRMGTAIVYIAAGLSRSDEIEGGKERDRTESKQPQHHFGIECASLLLH